MSFPFEILPAVNASLNATAAACLLSGYYFIRRKNIAIHRRFMLAACGASILFLISYLVYHAFAGATRFAGTGWSRPVYFTILVSHTILAIAVVPMAIASVVNGLRMRVLQHRLIARWTFPVWIYVSITGVVVYWFLYHLFP